MDLKSLGYFVAAVETGSITGAAARCYIAQPSISAAILKLESELNVTLLIRQKRGVSVTAAGQELYDSAKNLLNHAQSIKNRFNEQAEQQVVTIEVSHAIAFEYLHQLITVLREGNAHIQIKLIRPAQNTPVDATSKSDIRLTMEQAVAADEEFIAAWQDRYCLIIPHQHPLAHEDKIDVRQLNNVPFINRSFCDRSQAMADFLNEHQIQLNYVADVENEEWALSLVASGLGLSIVPLPSAQSALQNNDYKVVPLGKIAGLQDFERRIGVAIHYAKYTQPLFKEIALKLKSHFIQR
jgi:DNA-binding transcriptional LysR family regulator